MFQLIVAAVLLALAICAEANNRQVVDVATWGHKGWGPALVNQWTHWGNQWGGPWAGAWGNQGAWGHQGAWGNPGWGVNGVNVNGGWGGPGHAWGGIGSGAWGGVGAGAWDNGHYGIGGGIGHGHDG